MDHRAKASIGNVPLAAPLHRKINGRNRTEIDTDPTTLAPDEVDLKPIGDGSESAQIETDPASGASIGIDKSFASSHEVAPLSDLRLHQQMQVGGIDIGVTENTVFSQSGKGCGQTGFSGSSFAADNN
jgi:hypothetical protein